MLSLRNEQVCGFLSFLQSRKGWMFFLSCQVYHCSYCLRYPKLRRLYILPPIDSADFRFPLHFGHKFGVLVSVLWFSYASDTKLAILCPFCYFPTFRTQIRCFCVRFAIFLRFGHKFGVFVYVLLFSYVSDTKLAFLWSFCDFPCFLFSLFYCLHPKTLHFCHRICALG